MRSTPCRALNQSINPTPQGAGGRLPRVISACIDPCTPSNAKLLARRPSCPCSPGTPAGRIPPGHTHSGGHRHPHTGAGGGAARARTAAQARRWRAGLGIAPLAGPPLRSSTALGRRPCRPSPCAKPAVSVARTALQAAAALAPMPATSLRRVRRIRPDIPRGVPLPYRSVVQGAPPTPIFSFSALRLAFSAQIAGSAASPATARGRRSSFCF